MKNNFTENFSNWRIYYSKKFKEMFGFDMPFDVWGIDFFKLKEIMNIENDEIIEEIIQKRYGKEGLFLVQEILNNSPSEFKEPLTKE